jgi:hypothetical protein
VGHSVHVQWVAWVSPTTYLRQNGHGQTQVSVADAIIFGDPDDLLRALSFIA